MIKLETRQWVMVAGLAATLAAVAWVSQGDDARSPAVVAAAAPRARPDTARQPKAIDGGADTVSPERLLRVIALRSIGNPFQASDVAPPPPPRRPAITVAPPPIAPAAPVAPPFPWSFVGRLIEDPQNPSVFLARGDNLTVARLGETLDRVWKISGMDARGLRVEYLPLQSSQTVAMQAANDVGSGIAGGGNIAAGAFAPSGIPMQQAPFPPPNQLPGGDPAPDAPGAPANGNNPPPAGVPPVSGIDISNAIGLEPRIR